MVCYCMSDAIQRILDAAKAGGAKQEEIEAAQNYITKLEAPIKVEVLGGVAYCDDKRVNITDHDNEDYQ